MPAISMVYAVSQVGTMITAPFDVDMQLSSDQTVLILSSQTDQETVDECVFMLVQHGWILYEKDPASVKIAVWAQQDLKRCS